MRKRSKMRKRSDGPGKTPTQKLMDRMEAAGVTVQTRTAEPPDKSDDKPDNKAGDQRQAPEPKAKPEPEPSVTPKLGVDLEEFRGRFASYDKKLGDVVQATVDGMEDLEAQVSGIEQILKDRQSPMSPMDRHPQRCVRDMTDAILDTDVGRRMSAGNVSRGEVINGLPSLSWLMKENMRTDPEVIVNADVGGAATTYRRPGYVPYYTQEYNYGSLLLANAIKNSDKTVEYIREKRTGPLGPLYAKMRVAPNGASGADESLLAIKDTTNIGHFTVGTYVWYHHATGLVTRLGPISAVDDTPASKEINFASDIVDFDGAVDDYVTSENFGATAEEAKKPYMKVELEAVTEVMKMMAIMAPVSRNQLMTVDVLERMIVGLMRDYLPRNYSWHCIFGDSSNAGELDGLMTQDGATTLRWQDTTSKDNNRVDAIMEGMDLVLSGGIPALIMNKTTWRKIRSEKDGDARYLHSVSTNSSAVPIVTSPGLLSIGEYPVLIDYSVPTDFVIAVDLGSASEMYVNPAGGQITTGLVNDDLEKNIIRYRYEEMLLHAVLSVQAYVRINLDNAPT